MLPFLILLIVLGVIFWGTQRLIVAFGIGEPLRSVIYVILVVISLVAIADSFGIVLPLLHRSAP